MRKVGTQPGCVARAVPASGNANGSVRLPAGCGTQSKPATINGQWTGKPLYHTARGAHLKNGPGGERQSTLIKDHVLQHEGQGRTGAQASVGRGGRETNSCSPTPSSSMRVPTFAFNECRSLLPTRFFPCRNPDGVRVQRPPSSLLFRRSPNTTARRWSHTCLPGGARGAFRGRTEEDLRSRV